MKKIMIALLALLSYSTALRAQGYLVSVCVNLSGPQPQGPIVLTLNYNNGLFWPTIIDTLVNVTLPTTHCFSSYLAVPDSNQTTFTYGTVNIANCGPSFSASYQGTLTAPANYTLNLQYCGGNQVCAVTISQNPGTNILTANPTGTPPFMYSWDGGASFTNDPSFQSPGAGQYCVITIDSMGCVANDCYTNTGVNCEVLITSSSGPNGDTLTADFGFSTPGSFLWSTGETTQSIVVTNPGTYCVYATDTLACSDSSCFTYTGPTPNCGGYIVQNTSPSGFTTLEVLTDSSLIVSSIHWSTGEIGQISIPSVSGTYCATISYSNGCIITVCYNYSSGSNSSCSAFASVIADTVSSVLFHFYAYPNGTPPFTYSWLFSDGLVSNLPNLSHVFYNSNGNDWAFLTVTDSNNCVSHYTVPVPTQPSACSVPFTIQADYQNGIPGEVFFAPLTGTMSPSLYGWDLGNGTGSSVANPSTIYTSAGYYYVCLTTEVQLNPNLPATCLNVYCQSIYIDPAWWGNSPFGNNCSASFFATSSPSGSGIINLVNTAVGNNLVYAWTVGSQGSNLPYPVFTISQPGVYPVCLYILDTLSGCTDSYCDTIAIDSLGNFSRNGMSGNISIVVHQSAAPGTNPASLEAKDSVAPFMQIMPNPSNGIFTISIASPVDQQAQLDLFAISGQQIDSRQIRLKPGDNRIELNNPYLVPGTYSLRLVSQSKVQSSKLVVQP